MRAYELKPTIKMSEGKINSDSFLTNEIVNKVKDKKNFNIVIECYPGVDLKKMNKFIDSLNIDFKEKIWSEDLALQGKEFRKAILPEMTEDRVFGKFTEKEFVDYFIAERLEDATKKVETGINIIYGVGASYVPQKSDMIIHVDISRWEAQLRYRKKERVFFGGTLEDETIKNFKRGYFVEWRMADKIKKQIANKVDYFVDSISDEWKVVAKETFFKFVHSASTRPFRLVPYFDAGVWGGNWMEKEFNLGKNEHNRWAWGFDGVPEENSIIFETSSNKFEMPAINLCFWEPKNLLGDVVWNRFGEEFPIRFDFLDTIGGGNLSLQVHPTTQYIRDQFRAQYTQEESYYILDVDNKNDVTPICYLGIKDGVKKDELVSALREAQKTNKFDVNKYINAYEAKKHDHFIHPAGVIHSSASGCMVLEISATPYIFTFKLWDWGRLDLNGKPRPINIEHGKHVIDESFDTKRTTKELVSPFITLEEDKNKKIEKTGLHPRQFIETIRYTIKSEEGVIIKCQDSVNMLNVIDGEEAIVESVNNSFEPINVRFGETFIVPESCKEYRVKPNGKLNKELMVIQAYVRTKG